MAVKVSNRGVTITPTAWKWYIGAVVSFFMVPVFGPLVALVLALIGSGKVQNLHLSPTGISSRSWWSTNVYHWDEIDDFQLYKIRSGFFKVATMVSFTPVSKEGSRWAKTAKLLSGGTHSVPALGIPAKTLMTLMYAYKEGLIISDEIIAKVLGEVKHMRVPSSAGSPADLQPAAAHSSGGWGNKASAYKPAATRAANANTERQGTAYKRPLDKVSTRPANAPRQHAPSRSIFGRTGAKPKVKDTTFGNGKGGGPLVQDSASRRRKIGR